MWKLPSTVEIETKWDKIRNKNRSGYFLTGYELLILSGYYASEKAPLSNPQTGQHQSSGSSSKGVPGAIPLSGSPISGS